MLRLGFGALIPDYEPYDQANNDYQEKQADQRGNFCQPHGVVEAGTLMRAVDFPHIAGNVGVAVFLTVFPDILVPLGATRGGWNGRVIGDFPGGR